MKRESGRGHRNLQDGGKTDAIKPTVEIIKNIFQSIQTRIERRGQAARKIKQVFRVGSGGSDKLTVGGQKRGKTDRTVTANPPNSDKSYDFPQSVVISREWWKRKKGSIGGKLSRWEPKWRSLGGSFSGGTVLGGRSDETFLGVIFIHRLKFLGRR